MRDRRITGLVLVAALLLVAAVRHPSADIRILTHDSGDRSPAKVQAAIDLGVFAVSVLVTGPNDWFNPACTAPRAPTKRVDLFGTP